MIFGPDGSMHTDSRVQPNAAQDKYKQAYQDVANMNPNINWDSYTANDLPAIQKQAQAFQALKGSSGLSLGDFTQSAPNMASVSGFGSDDRAQQLTAFLANPADINTSAMVRASQPGPMSGFFMDPTVANGTPQQAWDKLNQLSTAYNDPGWFDPIFRGVGTAILGSAFGGALGPALGGSLGATAGKVVGNTLGNTFVNTAVNGGNIGDNLLNAGLSAGASYGGNMLGDAVGSPTIGKAIGSAVGSAATGGNPLIGALGSLANSGIKELGAQFPSSNPNINSFVQSAGNTIAGKTINSLVNQNVIPPSQPAPVPAPAPVPSLQWPQAANKQTATPTNKTYGGQEFINSNGVWIPK